jgi:membrane associated rhomboid family serine protease
MITIAIIVANCIISFLAFSNRKLMDDLIFYPPAITFRKQWYRFITCGFIHADIAHLIFNMYSFYLFGGAVEDAFEQIFGSMGTLLYVIVYFTALIVCLLPTYFSNRDNYNYRSLGASGAVSAIIFAYIFLDPTSKLGLMFIPIYAPAYIFGGLYLAVTYYLAKRGGGGINHSAHFWGAVYGIVFIIVTCYLLSNFDPIQNFLLKIKNGG